MQVFRSIPLNELSAIEAMGISCEALKQLNLPFTINDDELIIAETTGVNDASKLRFQIQLQEEHLIVKGDPDDQLLSAVEKEIDLFVTVFEQLRTSATPENRSAWNDALVEYKTSTHSGTDNERDPEEQSIAGAVQHPIITYGLVGANIIVFLIMLISGVGLFAPEAPDIINWGGNFGPFTKDGDWWRLFTCMFVHIGIVHLFFNMYALLIVGVYLEPILGKLRFIAAYVSTGIIASLVSIWWHKEPVVSAGASGAVFGMLGLFLALLSTHLIPKKIRMQLLQGIVIFVGYNLVNGLRSGIDNAAHIGGLLSGLAIGYVLYLAMRKESDSRRSPYPAVLVLFATALATYLFLQQNAPVEVKDDSEKFSRTMEHFGALEELALEAMNPADTVSEETYLRELKKTALTDWVECVNLFEEAEKFSLSPRLKVLRKDMLQYSNHRVQQTLLTIKAAEERTDRYKTGIDSLEEEIKQIIEKVQEGTSPTQEL